jgi:regulator of nucleoside diphosphate kinase
MTKIGNGGSKPRITLTAHDHERLSQLARAAAHTMPDVAAELTEELDRARVLAVGRHPVDVVCMGGEVVYRDDTTGKVQTVTLVYPNEADIAKGRVSVLTPVGTALIGLAVGKSINWKTRTGDLKRLTVLQVREAAPAEPRTASEGELPQPV